MSKKVETFCDCCGVEMKLPLVKGGSGRAYWWTVECHGLRGLVKNQAVADDYDFCSFTCLQKWASKQGTEIAA